MAAETMRDIFKRAFQHAGVELSDNKKNHIYLAFVTGMECAIKEKGSVCFTRIGTFYTKRANKIERRGVNPRTRKPQIIQVPERKVVRFRASRFIRRFLND
jgi:nucleoid DNA-binding protein